MTSSQLVARNGSSDITWTDEQKRLISSTIAPGCSPDELRLFAYHCQRTGLDPFSKQIYAIKRGGKMTIQAGIDGLRAIAERTGQLDGSQKFWCGEDGDWKEVWLGSKPPAAAKCVIHRKGCRHPFVGVALFRDYNAGQGLWTKMPSVMLGKVAEAQALRSGFPADLSGLYSSEEMDQADAKPIDVTPAPAPARQPAVAAAPVQPAVAEPVIDAVVEEPAPTPPAAPEPAAPEPAAPAAAVAQPPTDAEKLHALVTQRLTATGRRALLKAYEPVQSGLKDIDEWLATFTPQAKAHLAGLTEQTIAALNDGKHPKTGEQLVGKPGRRPAAAAEEAAVEGPIGDDPEQPFAAA
jgi:phage recombination protein Bet